MSRLTVLDIYSEIKEENQGKTKDYESVLLICENRIRDAQRLKKMDLNFDVPEVQFGIPLYNLNHCLAYIMTELRKNGFVVYFHPPRRIYISWQPHEVNKYQTIRNIKNQPIQNYNAPPVQQLYGNFNINNLNTSPELQETTNPLYRLQNQPTQSQTRSPYPPQQPSYQQPSYQQSSYHSFPAIENQQPQNLQQQLLLHQQGGLGQQVGLGQHSLMDLPGVTSGASYGNEDIDRMKNNQTQYRDPMRQMIATEDIAQRVIREQKDLQELKQQVTRLSPRSMGKITKTTSDNRPNIPSQLYQENDDGQQVVDINNLLVNSDYLRPKRKVNSKGRTMLTLI
jgi:hypothetical protein